MFGPISNCHSTFKRFNIHLFSQDVSELEKNIGCGQIEEVVIQAENELKLTRKILEWKSWEPLENEPPVGQWKWPM